MQLWRFFSQKLRYFSILVTIMAFIVSTLEVMGLGSIIPFLAILADPTLIDNNSHLTYLYDFSRKFGIASHEEFTLLVAKLAIFLVVFSIFSRGVYNFLTIKFVAACECELSVALFNKYMRSDYEFAIRNDSSISKKNILSETFMVAEHVIAPTVTIVSQGLTLILFLLVILIVSFNIAVSVFVISAALAAVILWPLSHMVMKLGDRRFKHNELRFKISTESFSILKEIKVRGDEDYFIQQFSQVSNNYRNTLSLMRGISIIPRYLLEGAAIGSCFAGILLLYVNGRSFAEIIQIVTLYAVVGYRALPATQNIYNSYTSIRSMRGAVTNLLQQLQFVEHPNAAIKTKTTGDVRLITDVVPTIIFDQVSYNFAGSEKSIIDNINLVIKPGQCIGVVGETGSGKTTLINILMGLYSPTKGSLQYQVDDKNYKLKNISDLNFGYVSQNIVLVNRSLAENIALTEAVENIDYLRLNLCLKIACLNDFVAQLDEGVHTFVGERGVRLSGGQRQRVAIARALYADPSILIFDEATSALDIITEKTIIDNIHTFNLKTTIVMISHRPQTLSICDKIYEMKSGRIAEKTHNNLGT